MFFYFHLNTYRYSMTAPSSFHIVDWLEAISGVVSRPRIQYSKYSLHSLWRRFAPRYSLGRKRCTSHQIPMAFILHICLRQYIQQAGYCGLLAGVWAQSPNTPKDCAIRSRLLDRRCQLWYQCFAMGSVYSCWGNLGFQDYNRELPWASTKYLWWLFAREYVTPLPSWKAIGY